MGVAAVGVAAVLLVASYSRQTAGATPYQVVAALSLSGACSHSSCAGRDRVPPAAQHRRLAADDPGARPAGQHAGHELARVDAATQQVTAPIWLVIWALSWSWILLIFPIFHLLLTFPDGRLLSPRWRWAVALEVAMVAVFVGFTAFRQSLNVLVDDISVWTVPNPIGVLPNNLFDATLGRIWGFGLLAITIASGAAVVLRFRRGSTMVRQQLKWPVLAVVLFGAVYGGRPCTPACRRRSILFGVSWRGSRSRWRSPCSATGCTRSTTSSAGPSRGR